MAREWALVSASALARGLVPAWALVSARESALVSGRGQAQALVPDQTLV